MAEKITAIVDGDIPAHRLLWIYRNDENKLIIGLPKEIGNYVDFVSTRDLQDGEEVTIELRDNRIWKVEVAGTGVYPGANVAVDTDGRVGCYSSAPIRIGYSLDAGEEGDVVRIVKHPKVILSKLPINE